MEGGLSSDNCTSCKSTQGIEKIRGIGKDHLSHVDESWRRGQRLIHAPILRSMFEYRDSISVRTAEACNVPVAYVAIFRRHRILSSSCFLLASLLLAPYFLIAIMASS